MLAEKFTSTAFSNDAFPITHPLYNIVGLYVGRAKSLLKGCVQCMPICDGHMFVAFPVLVSEISLYHHADVVESA